MTAEGKWRKHVYGIFLLIILLVFILSGWGICVWGGCSCVCVWTVLEARGRWLVPCFIILCLISLKWGLSLSLVLGWLVGGQQSPSVLLSLSLTSLGSQASATLGFLYPLVLSSKLRSSCLQVLLSPSRPSCSFKAALELSQALPCDFSTTIHVAHISWL